MHRRDFVRSGMAVGLGAMWGLPLPGFQQADLILRGATIFDGSGAPPREGDVAVVGDRIVEVGRISRPGAEEIDLAGLALSPGFIDIHSHAELNLLINPRAESCIHQGVTLEVVGQCGGSVGPWNDETFRRVRERFRSEYGIHVDFRNLGGFFRHLEREPVSINLASMVGHGTVRGSVMGDENREATGEELERMASLVRDALAQGAVGFSSGLEYTPGSFAPRSELVALVRELRGTGYPYASHIRNEDDAVLASVEEAVHVGRMAGTGVQVSHLKAQGRRNHWKAEVALRLIEEARDGGVDVHFDRYPYVAYSTGLSNLFPNWARADGTEAFLRRLQDPALRPRIESYAREKVALLGSWDAVQITSTRSEENAWARGRRMGELARERGEDPFELALSLLVEERNGVGMIGFGMSEENTERILTHPLGMICSDGNAYAPYGPLAEGLPHPRSYGTFPRVLGHYVRERKAMPLETAIHKMSGLPAEKLSLEDRGRIRPGAFADLVAFDPATVADRATFEKPHRYPEGIELVVVNGTITIRNGEHTGERAGRPVRGGRVGT